jgi:hypothetical protein
MNDEGLADAKAANPFRLPRLHPGIGAPLGPHGATRLPEVDEAEGEWPLTRRVPAQIIRCMSPMTGLQPFPSGNSVSNFLLISTTLSPVKPPPAASLQRSNPRGRVLAERRSGVEVDAHLDDLASGDAEIVPLENGFGLFPFTASRSP